jgi:hypothetical protein
MPMCETWVRLPGGAEVEVHHVGEPVTIEDGLDGVERDRHERHGERQAQL